jgi:hypothetical protein
MVLDTVNRDNVQQAFDKLCAWDNENGFKINREKQYNWFSGKVVRFLTLIA